MRKVCNKLFRKHKKSNYQDLNLYQIFAMESS